MVPVRMAPTDTLLGHILFALCPIPGSQDDLGKGTSAKASFTKLDTDQLATTPFQCRSNLA